MNYRVDAAVMQRQLPEKFRPKLHNGFAIGGICLIRLEEIRPRGMPAFLGMHSENAAHRVAVLWDDEQGKTQEGVYIPRRDTNSKLNQIAGGRVFPGEHHAAKFAVTDDGETVDFSLKSEDGEVAVEIKACTSNTLPKSSGFSTLEEASQFFEPGALGYSATKSGLKLDGIRLKTMNWKVDALDVSHVRSSYFDDRSRFPEGSVVFDCALIMRDIEHEWHSEQELHI